MGGLKRKIEPKLKRGLKGFSDELKSRERTNLHNWVGTSKESIDIRPQGDWSNKVGVNMGKLMSNQLNAKRENYLKYDFGGHATSPPIPFVSPVPNSKESSGLWWHVFPAVSGYSPISDALDSMPKFKTFAN